MGKRRLFIKKLVKALYQELQEHLKYDAIIPGLARARQLDNSQEPAKKRGRCHVCPRVTDEKATVVCSACNKNVWAAHCDIFCEAFPSAET